jgi:ribonuclease HI
LASKTIKDIFVNEFILFTDGSVDTKSNIGYGAYLLVSEDEMFSDVLLPKVKLKRFENTSSTKLEMQTVLWALSEVSEFEGKIIVYTDSQNIAGLMNRRERLGKNDFQSKKGRGMNHAELYRQFFRMTDLLNCEKLKDTNEQLTRTILTGFSHWLTWHREMPYEMNFRNSENDFILRLNSVERIPSLLRRDGISEQNTKKVLKGIGFLVSSAARSFNFFSTGKLLIFRL